MRATTRPGHAEARNATIQLTLQTPEASAVVPAPVALDGALDRAGAVLAREAAIVLHALVIVGPFALVALRGWLGRRGLRRRQDAELLSAP